MKPSAKYFGLVVGP